MARTVVVNRGYVPQGTVPLAPRRDVDIIGYLRWPERHSWFCPRHVTPAGTWFVRDHLAMAAARETWGEVAPFYVDQEAPVPAGGWPKPGPDSRSSCATTTWAMRITWFGLALALVGVYARVFVAGAAGAVRALMLRRSKYRKR